LSDDAEIEIDREYVVPLTKAWITPRHQRSSRAVRVLREFAAKHMKGEEVKIDPDLSEKIWERGMTSPPRKIKVRMTKDEDGLVRVSLPKIQTEATDSEPAENEKQTASGDKRTEKKLA
jgi:large subunit ribosomal protein L31e